ncbi:hypothetical protein D5S17_11775 [Pseudonocardiaceae bacterium YIM PH 21723]|nr:hypothetical protein D5S17_11775 [Pseudonocardiaceae bacterium YIM PH 21723]
MSSEPAGRPDAGQGPERDDVLTVADLLRKQGAPIPTELRESAQAAPGFEPSQGPPDRVRFAGEDLGDQSPSRHSVPLRRPAGAESGADDPATASAQGSSSGRLKVTRGDIATGGVSWQVPLDDLAEEPKQLSKAAVALRVAGVVGAMAVLFGIVTSGGDATGNTGALPAEESTVVGPPLSEEPVPTFTDEPRPSSSSASPTSVVPVAPPPGDDPSKAAPPPPARTAQPPRPTAQQPTQRPKPPPRTTVVDCDQWDWWCR